MSEHSPSRSSQAGVLRLFVTEALHEGARVAASAGQAHYLRHVMRRDDGAAVELFNGRDGAWIATLALQGKKDTAFDVTSQIRPQEPQAPLTLAFAPLKSQRLEYLIEKATELGVGTLTPIISRRAITARVNMERLQAIAIEAAEQCERTTVPAFTAPARLDDFMASRRTDSSPPHLFFLDEGSVGTGEAFPLTTALAAAKGPAVLLVGPEGGFTAEERQALRTLPSTTAVTLGPRILRAETAAVAAVACWQALNGDWHQSGPLAR